MEWTLTNLMIQTLTGAIGGNLIVMAAKEFSFRFLAHTLVGALGGGLTALFCRRLLPRR